MEQTRHTPSDYGFFELINENVQNEPATSYDVERAGQLAAIGIVHGKEFKPDDRMKKTLSDAAAVGQAAGRALQWRFAMQHPDWAYYEGSHWGSMRWQGGAFFETPPPLYEVELVNRRRSCPDLCRASFANDTITPEDRKKGGGAVARPLRLRSIAISRFSAARDQAWSL